MALTTRPLPGLAAWLLVTFAAAAIGAWASMDAGAFYTELEQPAWAPPGWVFSPVWTLLYLLMGIAAWLVWTSGGWRSGAHGLYLAQLVLNALWSWLFFGWRLGGAAFVEVLLLWGLILATLIAFWRVRPVAGLLLAPYLFWVSYAAALNFVIWRMNPQYLG